MLEKVIKRKFYLQRHLEAPLLQERESYLEEMWKRGSNRQTLKCVANYLLLVINSFDLSDDDKSEVSIEEILRKAEDWSNLITGHPMKKTVSPTSKDKFFCIAMDWLTHIGRLDRRCDPTDNVISRLFNRGFHKVKHLTAPLFPERVAYIEYWERRGAVDGTLRKIAQYQLHGIDLIPEIKGTDVISRQTLLSSADCWCKTEDPGVHKLSGTEGSKRAFLSIVGGWLDFMNRLEGKKEEYHCQQHVEDYLNWLTEDKGYSPKTIVHRLYILKNFMSYSGGQELGLDDITPTVLDGYLAHRSEYCNRKSIAGHVSVLRDFLRYAATKGWCKPELDKSMNSPRIYAREDIPSFIPWDDMCKVVERSSCNNKPAAIRNHAIIMLLSVYGLRSSEVANMKLADINWRQKQIYLRRAKLSKPQIMPLNDDVAQSILDYILHGRNNDVQEGNLFLLTRSPYSKITTSTVYQAASKALEGYHGNLKHRGPHSYRHTCATHLVNTGHTMKEVADVLGHQQLDTTQIYAKVDFVNLRKVSDMDWKGLL